MPKESSRTYPESQAVAPRATLSTIVAGTRAALPGLRARRAELERAAVAAADPPAWRAAFGHPEVSVIAEVKRRSPSAGRIAPGLDPAAHARSYVAGGARAISVLTEGPHFGGSLADLAAVRAAVPVPILRKDFIVDTVQVFESRAAGASAILLIARVLTNRELRDLAGLARDLSLGTLVEIHHEEELDRALAAEPDALGINSRDLETFEVDLRTVERLLPRVPHDIVAVAESGLATRDDILTVAEWGADAVLVGGAVAGSAQPDRAVAGLVGCPRRAGPRGGA
jgi:indole-3-glycerol phosphate synthase